VTGWLRRLLRRPTTAPAPSAPAPSAPAGSPEPCHCVCHGNPAIVHVAPCCRPCRHCGTLFRAGLAAHERACAARPA